jgi:DNA-binding HxlR family transcriptional regulator
MASVVISGRQRPSQSDRETAPETDIASLLRLLGAGASGAILLALGEGPLRTKDLTTRVPGYAPRTVYRYVGRLAEIGALEREEEPGVPSKVVHSLADPCGVDLHDLVLSYAQVSSSLERLGDGRVVPHSWGSLTLLADLWESGMFEAMNAHSRTATELARVDHDFSFHQVSRRTSLFMIGGMIEETQNGDRRRRYGLTTEAREATALIAALGRWRERYVVGDGEAGLAVGESAELLRAALPLVVLPEQAGKSARFSVTGPAEGDGDEGEVVWAEIGPDGRVAPCPPRDGADGWARAPVGEWIQTLLGSSRVRTGGDSGLVKECVKGMANRLWPTEPAPEASLG